MFKKVEQVMPTVITKSDIKCIDQWKAEQMEKVDPSKRFTERKERKVF